MTDSHQLIGVWQSTALCPLIDAAGGHRYPILPQKCAEIDEAEASLAACFINADPNNIFLTLCLCIIVRVIRYRERKNFSFALTLNEQPAFSVYGFSI